MLLQFSFGLGQLGEFFLLEFTMLPLDLQLLLQGLQSGFFGFKFGRNRGKFVQQPAFFFLRGGEKTLLLLKALLQSFHFLLLLQQFGPGVRHHRLPRRRSLQPEGHGKSNEEKQREEISFGATGLHVRSARIFEWQPYC